MKTVIAIDSFKGSLSSVEAAKAIEKGIKRACDCEVVISPIADGGEGTVDALAKGMAGVLKTTEVTGPLGEKVTAEWGLISDGNSKTAIIEMASAAGIALLDREKLNPLNTTTYGVGELINKAIDEGCRRFIVGIGGSATNDGGMGMLKALGFEFLDESDNPIPDGVKGLEKLCSVSDKKVNPKLAQCSFRVACDVTNPLCGENGCSAIFGPQKGATPKMIKDMDAWLQNYARITGGDATYPGTGAAGGMGYAFLNFTNAGLEPGIDIVLSETKLEEKIKDADIVITGEGRMDAQTVMGKAPAGVAKLAKKYGKRVLAFCGCASEDARVCNENGIDAFFPILTNVVTLDEALDKEVASANLELTAEQVFRAMELNYGEKRR